jgi:hypothetical protein
MASVAIKESTKKYQHSKYQAGYKRVQIWILDNTNTKIQNRIKIAAQQINQEHDLLVYELENNINDLLQDTPL